MKYVYITLPGLGDRRQALRVLFTQYLVSPHFFLRLTLTWGQGECGGNTCIAPSYSSNLPLDHINSTSSWGITLAWNVFGRILFSLL